MAVEGDETTVHPAPDAAAGEEGPGPPARGVGETAGVGETTGVGETAGVTVGEGATPVG